MGRGAKKICKLIISIKPNEKNGNKKSEKKRNRMAHANPLHNVKNKNLAN